MQLIKFETISKLAEGLSLLICQLSESKTRINVNLSGGSTPKAIFDIWAAQYAEILPWQKIHFYWGDERCVPPTDDMSNYGMTKKHLLDKVVIPKENIHRILGENNPETEAKRYAEVINQDTPIFDLLILGLGDDGHTASIFPYNIEEWDSNENCIVAAHPETGMKRVSITGKVINNAACVVFLVTGALKANKVKQITEQPDHFAKQYPAARVKPQSGKLFWFLDHEAAQEVNATDQWIGI